MKWLRFFIITIIFTIIQAGFFAAWRFKPDLLIILLVFFAIYCNKGHAITTSFIIGFAFDMIVKPVGPGVITFGLFGTLLSYLHQFLNIKRMFYQAIVIFVFGTAIGLSIILLNILKGILPAENFFKNILSTALFSAVVGPFLFFPIGWWMRIKTFRK